MTSDRELATRSLRLAVAFAIAGYAALLIIALIIRDRHPESPPHRFHAAAYVDECGRVRPDILDGVVIKGGTVRPKEGGVA
jgi:hypothetical protein